MLRPLARAASLVALTALPSFAHQVFPSSITLRPGGTDYIYVVDGGGCAATITAKSTSPSLVKLALVNMDNGSIGAFGTQVTAPGRIDQLFVVRAEANISVAASATVEICWVGSTAPNPPCSENNCSPYAPHPVAISIATDPLTFASSAFSGIVGDPITTDDGEKVLREAPDFDLGGPMPLVFERSYASRLVSDGNASSALGPSWASNWDWSLEVSGTSLEIVSPEGRLLRFQRSAFDTEWVLEVYDDEPFQLADSGANRLLLEPATGLVRTFDSSGKLTKVEDGHGNAHTVSYNGSTRTGVSDGLGRSLSFVHASGKLTSVSDGTRTVNFGYTGSLLTSATDASGETTSYAYDPSALSSARMTSLTRPEGNTPYVHVFDVSGRAISETDAEANATALAFDGATGETTITDALGDAQVHDHADGELVRWEDEAGAAVTMSYDSTGRRKSITDRLGRTTSWTFHAASGRPASITEADGSVTSFEYTSRTAQGLSRFDLTSVDLPGGASESYAYDSSGNLTSATDRDGEVWSFTYNARGQVLTVTDPEGGVTTLTYNADGTLATSTDAANHTTTYDYDALRRLDLVTRPDGSTVAFTYDALDRVLSITNEDSRTTSFVYDGNGRLVTVTDPSAKVWTLAYDDLDRLVSVVDPEGRIASATFDPRGELATLTNGAGETTSFGYDARGRLATVSDALTNVWLFGSNAEGLPSSIANPKGDGWTFTSDSRGRRTRATTPLSRSTSYSYDALDRLTRVTDPAGRATTFGYDRTGRPTSVTLPAAGTATAARDGNGEVSSVTYPGGGTWSVGRDAAGRVDSATDPLGRTTSATHDARSRVSGLTFPGGLGTGTFTWTDGGLLTDVALSDGTSLHYDYDANARMVSAGSASFGWDDSGAMTDSDGIAIARDGARRIESVTYAPGLVVSYAYDARGLLETVTDWVGGVTVFTYDDAARLVAIARPNGLTTRYTYDGDSRLTKIQEIRDALLGEIEEASISITHVSTDQIQRLDVTPLSSFVPQLGQVLRTFDAAGQLGGANFDARGNLLVDGAKLNTFDLAGRLTSHSNGVNSSNIDYDDLGFPVLLSGPAGAQFGRNYAAGGITIVLRNGGGVDQQYLVTTPAGGALHIVDAATNERSFFHHDATFSTRFLSNDAGVFTDEYGYDPYGGLIGHTGTSTQPFTFRGHYGVQQVPGTTLHFFGTRPYDASTGLFLTPDRQRLLDARFANPYLLNGVLGAPPTCVASTTAPIPRFADTSPSSNARLLNVGLTNLLYPFVSNQGGFDTGLAIRPQFGLGDSESFAGEFTRPLGSFNQTGGQVVLDRSTPNFQGYVIAQCDFNYAHGFAFINDFGARNLANGYLALVLGDSARPSPSAAPATSTEPNHSDAIRKFRLRFPPGRRLRLTDTSAFVAPTAAAGIVSGQSLTSPLAQFVSQGGGLSPGLTVTQPYFSDVPNSSPFCRFIEELSRRGIVSGTSPNSTVPMTSDELRRSLVRSFFP